jgi:alpha-L-arabinofuranosidase
MKVMQWFSRNLLPVRAQRRVTAIASGVLTVALLAAASASARTQIRINVRKPGITVSPTLWGIFFEEINHSGEGGLWGQLVNNPTIKAIGGNGEPVGWSLNVQHSAARMAIDADHALNRENPLALRVDVFGSPQPGGVALINSGYWGMNLKRGEHYHLSLYARRSYSMGGTIEVALLGRDGQKIGTGEISGITRHWKKFHVVLTADANDPTGSLAVYPNHSGSLWLTCVNMFSSAALADGGFRPGLLKMLMALHPSFVRFPGGNYIEGNVLTNGFYWKRTIGPMSRRPGHENDSWGYWSTDQLGYAEYLNLCRKLGAAPLFGVNCGLSLGMNDKVPLKDMGPWVRSAVEAVQYANGSVKTGWGKVRAKDGYPKPFGLKYLEIGNESWWAGPYSRRYKLFYKALHKAWPKIKLIASGNTEGQPTQIVDQHFYPSAGWFWANRHRYDTYSRTGPKVFVGEYAVTQNAGLGNLRAALGEAAWMTGLERNSDVVVMASYAPLFVNANNRAWNPDLIVFNSSKVFGTPSYWVQQMFSDNRVHHMLPITIKNRPKSNLHAPAYGSIGLGTWNTQSEYRDIKVTHHGQVIYQSHFGHGKAAGWHSVFGHWQIHGDTYRQVASDMPAISVLQSARLGRMKNYTLTLQARKLSGAEGFLILFHVRNSHHYYWWNIGGWTNTTTGIERTVGGVKSEVGPHYGSHVTSGRWYKVRIVAHNGLITCYLDGHQIESTQEHPASSRFCAIAGVTRSGHTIVVTAVNGQTAPVSTQLNLSGAGKLSPEGKAITLTAAHLSAENSFAHPMRVSPVVTPLKHVSAEMRYTFPARSLVILRLHLK